MPITLAAVDAIRIGSEGRCAFRVARCDAVATGWLDYESLVKDASATFARPAIGERDLLTINYTSGTTSRPKGVMITHRNAWMNCVGMLTHTPMTPADAYLWTLPMFHANGWTFTWTVTAAGAKHICLPKFDAADRVHDRGTREASRGLCAAPTVLIMLANAPAEAKALAPNGVGVMTAGAPPAAVTIQRIEDELGLDDHPDLRPHRNGAGDQHLRAAAGASRRCSTEERARIKARQGVELITSGELRVVDDQGREVPADGTSAGEIIARGNVIMAGLLQRSRGHREMHGRRLVPHRRCGGRASRTATCRSPIG